MERNRVEPAVGALFSLNMLTGTPGGDTYTEPEIRSWMEQADILPVERVDLGRGRSLMIGNRI